MFYSTVSPRKYASFEQTQSPLFNPHFLAYYRYFSPCKCPMVSVYLNITTTVAAEYAVYRVQSVYSIVACRIAGLKLIL